MNRKQMLLLILAVAILGGVGWLIQKRLRTTGPLAVGDTASDFSVAGLNSRPLRLDDYRHRVVVLNFWATWCPPCVEETPSLEKFARQARAQGVEVIGISVDQDADALSSFIAKYQVSYPIGRDPGGQLARSYGTTTFPETYILDRDGNIADKIIGGIDWEDPRIVKYVAELAHSGR